MQTMPPKLIITRPADVGASFACKVQSVCEYPLDVILSPALQIVPLDAHIPDTVDHVVFTSVNGVAQAVRLGVPISAHAWCVGKRTSDAAMALGFRATDGGGDASRLLQTLLEARPKGLIIHVAGKFTRGDIATRLQGVGLKCMEITAYDQKVIAPTEALVVALSGDQPVIIPLFSARSGLNLIHTEWRAPVHVIAMSKFVAESIEGWGADTIQTAEIPDEKTMIDLTCIALDRLRHGASVA